MRSAATSRWSFASLPPVPCRAEASGSAHHWARRLIKLGHDARNDASGLCEAVNPPDPLRTRAKALIDKKPFKLVAVALANKIGSEAGTEDNVLDAICGHTPSSVGGR